MENIENTFQIKCDFTEVICQKKIRDYFKKKVDVILSDMAVNTTGNKDLDSIVTGELTIEAMMFSKEMLKKKWTICLKNIYGINI